MSSSNIELQSIDSPSHNCQEYRDLMPKLDFVLDIWKGRTAWVQVWLGGKDYIKANRYLPQEREESNSEYESRLLRAYFSCKFRHAIEGFAGYLSRFTISEDIHPTLEQRKENIDLKGNSLEVFFRSCDEMALRDEHCFVLVEFPKRPIEIKNYTQEKNLNLLPYLVKIDARCLINWIVENDKLVQVTIRERVMVREGRFGHKEQTQYRVLTAGAFEVYRDDSEGGKDLNGLIDSGSTTLDFIPLIAYSLTSDTEIFTGDPPLYDLAELNLKHYQLSSEKTEVLHKCNIPFLQINERTPGSFGSEIDRPLGYEDTIKIGSNTVFKNVDCSFIEPSGSATSTTQQDISQLEQEINERTLSFLSGLNSPRTATEVSLQSSATQSNLINWARRKESNIQRIFDYWGKWVDAGTDEIGRIKVEDGLLDQAMSDARANFLVELNQSGNLSTTTLLKLLRDGGVLGKDLEVDEELKLIKAMIPPAPQI